MSISHEKLVEWFDLLPGDSTGLKRDYLAMPPRAQAAFRREVQVIADLAADPTISTKELIRLVKARVREL